MEKEIVILTKSSKHGGCCVAGIDLSNGEWIRLVSDNKETNGALSASDICYNNGELCEPLDVVRVSILNSAPLAYQPENHLIDSSTYWVKLGTMEICDITSIHPPERHTFLYGNTEPFVTEDQILDLGYSLVLIEISELVITHSTSPYSGKPRTKARFTYNGRRYNYISVTDPDYYSVPNNTRIDNAFVVVSLPDEALPEDCFYKFVAKIFPI